jgi:hypothetical protein
MSGPFDGGGVSVTIKGDEPGGKFNDAKSPGTWLVFHGTVNQVKAQIIEAFGMESSANDRTLLDLQNEATKMFKAVNMIGGQLGGTVLNSGKAAAPAAAATPASQSAPVEDKGGNDVWAKAAESGPPWKTEEEEKAEAQAKDPILAALEGCQTVAEVQQVWAENQTAFNTNPEYMSAYKARGKALSSK